MKKGKSGLAFCLLIVYLCQHPVIVGRISFLTDERKTAAI